ncbi:MAG TPA: MaoC family dehydratase [Solirubrobacterales bacterium]|jgi:acyl dehydratase|nr:MaoC family dehydratase [Solirubrobacterales bacterium]
MAAADRPLLPFSEFDGGRAFAPVEFASSPELVAEFVAATGDDNPLYSDPDAARAAGFESPVLPPGLAGVWARLAYASRHRLPAGGVMAAQDYRLERPIAVGSKLELDAEALPVDLEDPKRRVTIECRARFGDAVVGEVTIDARWGAEEA